MFCPYCKAEYEDGITECYDCQIPLVHSLSDIPKEDHELQYDYFEVASTMNLGDIALLQSVFDSENIDYQILGEAFNNVRPLLEPARFVVREDQVDIAKKLIKDMDVHLFALSTKRTDEKKVGDRE